jgi:hypothetical protein
MSSGSVQITVAEIAQFLRLTDNQLRGDILIPAACVERQYIPPAEPKVFPHLLQV